LASTTAACPGVSAPYNCYRPGIVSSTATATFTDVLTITNQTSEAITGDFFQGIEFDGAQSADCLGTYTCNEINARANTTLIVPGRSNQVIPTGVSKLNLLDPVDSIVPEDGSIQITIGFTLESEAVCSSANGTTCQTASDFSDTAIVTGVGLMDSNGNIIPGLSITSASGTDYNDLLPTGGETPEPSSAVLLGTGAIGLLGVVLRRPRSRRAFRSAAELPSQTAGLYH
jgi:hypothetical protein